MKRSILKPIAFGILFGAAVFFAPFMIIKVLIFFIVLGFIFKLFWRQSGGTHGDMNYRLLYADKVRSMNDEEYAQFKNNMNKSCCGHSCRSHYCHCGNRKQD